ncbi:MAG TPA: glycoside hydrolase family 15 protein, partial [Ktedonobacterales bacterium]
MNTTLQRRLAYIRTFAGTQRGRVTLGISVLALVSVVVVAILLPLSSPSLRTGRAPDGPGDGSTWAPTTDTMVGTALSSESNVWFTGGHGVVTATFFPSADTVNSSVLELLIGDRSNHWADEERADTISQTTIYDPRSLAWKVINTAKRGAYTIQKVIYADPSRNSIVQDVTFTVSKGHLSDYQLYVYYDPAIHNTGDSNFSATREANGLTALVTTNNTTEYASALATSLPYLDGRTSSGFVGQNDGLADLKGTFGCGSETCPDYRMTYGYQQASKGNTAQIGELDLSNGRQNDTGGATKRTFRLVLSFGKTSGGVDASSAAMDTLHATLRDRSDLLGMYVSQWHAFDQRLTPPPAVGATADVQKARQEEYYLAINLLKAAQDKQTKAFVAGLGNPWGPSHGDSESGGYHLVWMRDMYKVANALIVAGDSEDAKAALQWAFTTQQQADGHFPQNSALDGTPYWNGVQMDEQAFPLALAWRLGLTDKATYLQHIKPAAEYIVMHGPETAQERWEENGGYSPSTIAAEIAGLTCAAAIARANGDSASATQFQATADEYQRKVESWTFTTTGPLGNGHYYLRLAD